MHRTTVEPSLRSPGLGETCHVRYLPTNDDPSMHVKTRLLLMIVGFLRQFFSEVAVELRTSPAGAARRSGVDPASCVFV